MRDRTADLLDANQALSQLSYSPLYIDKDIFYASQNVQQQSVYIHKLLHNEASRKIGRPGQI